MVSVWVTNGGSIVADGAVNLSNGRTFVLSEIPGNNWNAKRLEKLTEAVQALMDHRRLRSDLAPDDFDLLMSQSATFKEDFTTFYGGRMFLESDAIVSRSDVISFTLVDGDLVPHSAVVR